MITIQIVPRGGHNAYELLRRKVIHDAQTWSWANRAKTRLRHTRDPKGYIEVAKSGDVVVGKIHARGGNTFFLVEKFIGRLIAWFEPELFAINLQFIPDDARPRKRRRK